MSIATCSRKAVRFPWGHANRTGTKGSLTKYHFLLESVLRSMKLERRWLRYSLRVVAFYPMLGMDERPAVLPVAEVIDKLGNLNVLRYRSLESLRVKEHGCRCGRRL